MPAAELSTILATQTRARERGADDGRNNLPRAHETEPSQAESAILSLALEEKAKALQTFRASAAELTQELDEISGSIPNRVLLSTDYFATHLDATLTDLAQNVLIKYRNLLGKRRNFRHFRTVNELERDAAKTQSAFDVFGVMVFIIVLDGVANALFFKDYNVHGIIGGFFLALVISLFNVCIGYTAGLLPWRYFNHINKLHLVWSLPLLSSLLAAILAFNLAVAHYRELLIKEPETLVSGVIQSLMRSPLGIDTIQSWLLAAIGIGIALYSAYKGYNTFDPYPRYGRVAREFEDAQREYDDAIPDLRHKLQDAARLLLQDAKTTQEKTQDLANSVATLEGRFHALAGGWSNECNEIAQACNTALRVYRDANRRVRDEPAPGYFDADCSIDCSEDLFDAMALATRLAAAARQAAQASEDYDELTRTAPILLGKRLSTASFDQFITRIHRQAEDTSPRPTLVDAS